MIDQDLNHVDKHDGVKEHDATAAFITYLYSAALCPRATPALHLVGHPFRWTAASAIAAWQPVVKNTDQLAHGTPSTQMVQVSHLP